MSPGRDAWGLIEMDDLTVIATAREALQADFAHAVDSCADAIQRARRENFEVLSSSHSYAISKRYEAALQRAPIDRVRELPWIRSRVDTLDVVALGQAITTDFAEPLRGFGLAVGAGHDFSTERGALIGRYRAIVDLLTLAQLRELETFVGLPWPPTIEQGRTD